MPIWLTLVLALGGTALIQCIVGFVFNLTINGTKAKKEENEKKRVEEIRSIIQEENQKQNTHLESIEGKVNKCIEGTITSIRSNLKLSLELMKAKGYATPTEKAAWMDEYQEYADLGGNHFAKYVDAWKKQVENFPEAPENNKER